MSKIEGDKAAKFVAWLACAKGFLPTSMTISEASQIFLRKCEDDERAKQEVLQIKKIHYTVDEVKDGQAHKNTDRESGAAVAGQVVESSSTT